MQTAKPMLLISAEPNTNTFGKGWGVLHEITEQKKVTEPITAFSATAQKPSDIPDFFAKAFFYFQEPTAEVSSYINSIRCTVTASCRGMVASRRNSKTFP